MGDTVTAMVRGTMAILVTTDMETVGTGIVAVTVRTADPGTGGENKKRGKASNLLGPFPCRVDLPRSDHADLIALAPFFHQETI